MAEAGGGRMDGCWRTGSQCGVGSLGPLMETEPALGWAGLPTHEEVIPTVNRLHVSIKQRDYKMDANIH